MAESELTVMVRVVPGSTSARVMLEVLEYLKGRHEPRRSEEYESFLIESMKQSLQRMPEDAGADLIQWERSRQLFFEKITAEHDDKWTGGELIEAACAYGTSAEASYFSENNVTFSEIRAGKPPKSWPWEEKLWKRSSTPIGDLVKAGALVAAEIDRLKRIIERESQ